MDHTSNFGGTEDDRHKHPYYPTSLCLPDYIPNDRTLRSMATDFILLWVVVLGLAWFTSVWLNSELRKRERLIVIWFVLCGTLHVFFEGYFVLNHASMVNKQDLFGQLWKEYALSDSRYLTQDVLVLCAETITIILWGPLSYLTAVTIVYESPYRHPLQSLVSFGQFFGDLLYLATSFVELYARDISYSRPEPYYLWFYFSSLNAIWLVIPGILIYQSTRAAAKAFEAWDEVRVYKSQRLRLATTLTDRDKTE